MDSLTAHHQACPTLTEPLFLLSISSATAPNAGYLAYDVDEVLKALYSGSDGAEDEAWFYGEQEKTCRRGWFRKDHTKPLAAEANPKYLIGLVSRCSDGESAVQQTSATTGQYRQPLRVTAHESADAEQRAARLLQLETIARECEDVAVKGYAEEEERLRAALDDVAVKHKAAAEESAAKRRAELTAKGDVERHRRGRVSAEASLKYYACRELEAQDVIKVAGAKRESAETRLAEMAEKWRVQADPA